MWGLRMEVEVGRLEVSGMIWGAPMVSLAPPGMGFLTLTWGGLPFQLCQFIKSSGRFRIPEQPPPLLP